MGIIADIAAFQPDIKALRRQIHANPELGFEESQTADLIAESLGSWGIEVHRGLAQTGIVGVLRAGSSTRSIGLRADMDALPMKEANTFAHRSQSPGKMHACGHDGHMAMLLGAARHLADKRDFDGTVIFIFQPAEEIDTGAQHMIADGLFEKFPVEAVFGMHNTTSLPAGHFAMRAGPIMAATGTFRVRIIGVGAHAAAPHKAKDPLFAGVQIVNALQGVISRNKKPLDAAVISVTQFNAGDAINVIPGVATFAGSVRTFESATLGMIESRIRAIVDGVAAAHDCIAEMEFVQSCPATVNTPREADFAASVMRSIVGDANVKTNLEPTMGSEDFAFMLNERPGAYAFLGIGGGEHREPGHGPGPCEVHNPSYDFNDDVLPIGSSFWAELSRQWLNCKNI